MNDTVLILIAAAILIYLASGSKTDGYLSKDAWEKRKATCYTSALEKQKAGDAHTYLPCILGFKPNNAGYLSGDTPEVLAAHHKCWENPSLLTGPNGNHGYSVYDDCTARLLAK